MRKQIKDTVRQLRQLLRMITLRRLLVNRFVMVAVAALLLTVSVQGYVAANNEGKITGQVVDEDGDPVANATVYIQEVNIRNQAGATKTTTDTNGYYEFTNQTELLEFRIWAVKENGGQSPQTRHHLYFRGQSTTIQIVINADVAE